MLDRYGSVVVTGGMGFIGRHLSEGLVALGKKVVVADLAQTGEAALPPRGTKLVPMDVRDARCVKEVIRGADLVFHVAGNANVTVSVEDTRLDFETNAVGTFNVLEVAKETGAKVVYVSSAHVYGASDKLPLNEADPVEPAWPYGASKRSGELSAVAFHHTHGLPTVVARLSCVYGPGEYAERSLVETARYLRWHLNAQPVQIVGDPDRKTRDFVHVSDVVEGLTLLAERAIPGEIYNLGSGQEVSMRRLTEVIGEVTGEPVRLDVRRDVIDDTYRQVMDIRKAGALGFAPGVPLHEGVRQLARQLGERPEVPTATVSFVGEGKKRVDPNRVPRLARTASQEPTEWGG